MVVWPEQLTTLAVTYVKSEMVVNIQIYNCAVEPEGTIANENRRSHFALAYYQMCNNLSKPLIYIKIPYFFVVLSLQLFDACECLTAALFSPNYSS